MIVYQKVMGLIGSACLVNTLFSKCFLFINFYFEIIFDFPFLYSQSNSSFSEMKTAEKSFIHVSCLTWTTWRAPECSAAPLGSSLVLLTENWRTLRNHEAFRNIHLFVEANVEAAEVTSGPRESTLCVSQTQEPPLDLFGSGAPRQVLKRTDHSEPNRTRLRLGLVPVCS